MKRTVACLVLASSLLVGACSQPDVVLGSGGGDGTARPVAGGDEPPTEDPYLIGKVVNVNRSEPVTTDVLGSIHVKGTPGAGGEPEAVAGVAKDVPVLRETGGAYEPMAFDDIAKGDTVSLWITGEVMESFPVQVSTTFVVVQE